MLRGVERLLECAVEAAPGVAIGQGQLVGVFELAENFGLTQDHRVETRSDAEQVVQTLRLGDVVDFAGRGVNSAACPREKRAQSVSCLARFDLRGRIDFDPVAGGKDDGLFSDSGFLERAQGRREVRRGKSKSLAHLDRRGMVAEADDEY